MDSALISQVNNEHNLLFPSSRETDEMKAMLSDEIGKETSLPDDNSINRPKVMFGSGIEMW